MKASLLSFIKKRKYALLIGLALSLCYYAWLPPRLFTDACSTVLYDKENRLLAAHIAGDGQWRFPAADSVPCKFKACILAFEDNYFYRHPGINPVSLWHAFSKNLSAGKVKSGGSTITMQLARLMRHGESRSYWHKLVEMLLAFRIELSYKKNSILSLYAAHAPYGSNVVGLEAAAWRYFNRPAHRLSWAESATLAVLPNAPSLIFPGKNHTALLNKRNRLLKKLYEQKLMDESTYRLALREPLPEKPYALPALSPHLLSRACAEHGSGKRYHTTLVAELQEEAANLLNRHIQNLSANGIYNAAAIILETESGRVLAYVGNSASPTHEHDNYVDVANAPRSTGSILKPFLYALSLDEGRILPNSLLEDIPTREGSYKPQNFNLSYDGLVPAGNALARSLNVPAVKLLREYGVSRFQYRLKQFGFTTFTKPAAHYGLSLILGGGEATLFDVAGAYASLGRSLAHYTKYHQYTFADFKHACYIMPEKEEKNRYYTNAVLSAGSIWSVFNMMTELARPEDYSLVSRFTSGSRLAWKTGTSFGFRDAWAVGVNPKYTVAVWVGNADGEGRPGLTGISAAAPLLFELFNSLPASPWFEKPYKDMIKLGICKQSGFKASDICPEKVIETIPKSASKAALCPFHKMIFLDATGQYRVNSNCYPVAQMKRTAWFVMPPLQEYFYKQHNAACKPLPPFLEGCEGGQRSQSLDIVYPLNGLKLYIPYTESGAQSDLILKATHKNSNALLYWHLDGNYIGSTTKFHELKIRPAAGKHLLEVVDEQGESATCSFEIIAKARG